MLHTTPFVVATAEVAPFDNRSTLGNFPTPPEFELALFCGEFLPKG
jgi:hypothetical protein